MRGQGRNGQEDEGFSQAGAESGEPVVAEAEVAAVLADEADVALLPVGLGLALAHRPRHAPTRAATGPHGGFLGLPLPHPARRLRDGTEAVEAGRGNLGIGGDQGVGGGRIKKIFVGGGDLGDEGGGGVVSGE